MTVDEQYQQLLKETLRGETQKIGRNGSTTVAIPNVALRVDMGQHYPLLRTRDMPKRLAVDEQLWFMQGTADHSWFGARSKAWAAFVNKDGDVPSNYGMRYRRRGVDQFKKNFQILTKDPSSRQACFDIWDARQDAAPEKPSQKNIPCLPFLTMNIIGNKLNVLLHQRSCDIILGLPHDIAGVCFFAMCWAKALKVELGSLLYTIANAHIYDNHIEAAKTMAEREPITSPIAVSLGDFDPLSKALEQEQPDWKYLDQVSNYMFEQIKSQYTPHPAIPNLIITV